MAMRVERVDLQQDLQMTERSKLAETLLVLIPFIQRPDGKKFSRSESSPHPDLGLCVPHLRHRLSNLQWRLRGIGKY